MARMDRHSGGLTVKTLRWGIAMVCSVTLGLLCAAGVMAQNQRQPGAAHAHYRTHFVVYEVQKKRTAPLFTIDGEWHAPNWSRDGRYIIADMGGSLYRIPVSGANKGVPEKIDVSVSMRASNDHALAWDGRQIADTGFAQPMPAGPRTPGALHNSIFVMNMDGSGAHEIHLGWLHGWSPDGKQVVYVQMNGDNYDVYRVNTDGSGELQMTRNKAQDDGPEYSADGKWVYFCSNRSGKWDAWRMPADGAGPDDQLAERVTMGEDTQDWFPHISPDGKWLYTISYPMDHPEHSFIGDGMKIKLLRLKNGVGAEGAELTTVRTFFGGQGSANTGGWSPDSTKFAWTEYEAVGEAGK